MTHLIIRYYVSNHNHMYRNNFFLIYLFIFGCVWSSLLHVGFL